MNKKLIPVFLTVLLVFGFVIQAAQAQLISGPLDRRGMPLWIEDATGLGLQPCDAPADPEAGPCFPEPGVVVFWGGEAVFRDAAETGIPGLQDLRLIMGVSGLTQAHAPAPAGAIITEIIFRMRVDTTVPGAPQPGDVITVATPYGTFTQDVEGQTMVMGADGDVLGRTNVILVEEIALPPFSAGATIPSGPINAFLTPDRAAAALLPPDPETGLSPLPPVGFLGGHDPVPVNEAGAVFSVTVNGATVFTDTGSFALQGKIHHQPGIEAVVDAVTNARGRITGRTLTITAALPAAQEAFGETPPLPAGSQTGVAIPLGRLVPARVAATDGATPPVDALVTALSDTIVGAAATRNARNGAVRVTASSTLTGVRGIPRPVLTVTGDNGFTATMRGRALNIRAANAAGLTSVTITSSAGAAPVTIAVP